MSRKVAVITGASRGIGLAIAHALADVADLCLCARGKEELARATATFDLTTRVVAETCDVSRAQEVQWLIDYCHERLGPVDWLVNNAGLCEVTPVGELTEEQWDRVLDTNLKGPFLCTRAALPDLVERQGRVVSIGSISGTLGTPLQSAYNASKWGLSGLTKTLAEELREKRVMVSAVLPGSVDTSMLDKRKFAPVIEPQEIAGVVRFLLADAPFSMTGSLVEAFG